MHQVRKLIAQIRALLGENPPALALDTLAAEYAHWREDASRRLEACSAMLARGSEHSALELAEAEPPLLDLVAELSFAEEPQWLALCASHGLATGPLLDMRTVSAMDAVYAKGLSPNSPLYHEYRSAVTSRDDAKALHIIRTITKVNPSDSNARSELDRMLNKLMHAKLEDLRAALAKHEDEAVAEIVEDLEQVAPAEKLAAQADYIRGLAVRKRVRLAGAMHEVPAVLAEMERLQQSGQWPQAAEKLQALDEQESSLGLTLDAAQAARRDAVRQYVAASLVDEQTQTRFIQAVEKLRIYGEQAATRCAGSSNLSLEEAKELQAKYDQFAHEVKRFGRQIPEPAASSIASSEKVIYGVAGGKRRAVLLRRGAVAAVVVLLVGAVLAWYTRSSQIQSYREQLGTLRTEGKVLAAQELIEKIQQKTLLNVQSDPDLQASLADAGRWVAAQMELRDQADAQIASIEKADVRSAEPIALHTKWTAASKLVSTLAPELAPPLNERLGVLRRSFDSYYATVKAGQEAELRKALSEAEAKLAGISYDKPIRVAQQALLEARPLLEKLESAISHPVAALRPALDIITAGTDLLAKKKAFQLELDAIATSEAGIQTAHTLADYGSALNKLAAVRFRELSIAQPVIKSLPTAEEAAARLLTGGDVDAWKAVQNDRGAGATLRPKDVRPEEVAMLLALRDDPNLVDVWQWTLVSNGQVKNAWSRGKPRETIVGGEKRYAGPLWNPDDRALAPTFVEVKLPDRGAPVTVNGVALSGASQLITSLKLGQMTDSAGKAWNVSMLEVLTQLAKSQTGSPLARGILMQQLGALTALRPFEWGRHYSPSLNADLARLESICQDRRLNTYEWMLPSTVARLEAKFSAFFSDIKGHDYFVEARRYRDLMTSVRDAGVRFAGYIDPDGKAHILPEAQSATELWCSVSKDMKLLKVVPGAANSGLADQGKACPPYSPLIYVPLDRSALLKQASVTHESVPFLHAP